MIFQLIATLGGILFVYLLVKYLLHVLNLSKYPPGPFPLPIIGNIYQLGSNPYQTLKDFSKTYGDVFSISLGHKRVVVVTSITHAREALIDKSIEFAGRPQDVFTAGVITRGFKDIAFGDYGPIWQANRKLAHSSLKLYGNGMEKMEGHIQDEADDLYDRIDKAGGMPINPHEDFALAVINIICSLVFGKRYDKTDPEFLNVVKYNTLITQGFSHVGPIAFLPWLRFFPNRGLKKIDTGIKIRDTILRKQLDLHRSSFNPDNIRDLTDALLLESTKEENKPIEEKKYPTDDHLEMILHDAFTAGSETTTTSLRWAMLLLVRNPKIQEKAVEELNSIVGNDRRPSLKDREKLPYVCAIVNEILRISSVIPLGVPHKTTAATKLAGHNIPKNTHIVFNNWAFHHDEREWENPDDFKPERWIDDMGHLIPDRQRSFLPFSAGRRVCLGEPLARTEIFLFLTRILQRYCIDKAPGGPIPALLSNRSVIHSPKPFQVVFTRRSLPA